jgi:DMSO/TMAO reductase YedYZ molybdopterin-dependent catalytic subunit
MNLATLDRVLAVLVVALASSGLLSLKAGSAGSAWVFTLHGLLGGALLAATVLKLRRSAPRAARAGRWLSLALALLVTLAALGALTGGFLWMAADGPLVVGSWTVLTLHAWFGLVLLPLVVLHLLPRRWRLLRPFELVMPPGRFLSHVSRRSFLAVGGLAVAGFGAFLSTRLIEFARGGNHRFTGSRWLPSGGVPPPTTFYGEGPPTTDTESWRLTVAGSEGPSRSVGLAELEALGVVEQTAVLDCTSGWALETEWHGVPLPAVLEAAGQPLPTRGSVRVISATGWSTILSPDVARTALLATRVAGAPLPIGNGAPCRLVVPGRRGLDWVKWVIRVETAQA